MNCWKCDRCKRYVENEDYITQGVLESYDLCDSCRTEFIEWCDTFVNSGEDKK